MTDSALLEDALETAPRSYLGIGGVSGAVVRRLVWIGYAVLAGAFGVLVIAPMPERAAYAVGQWLFAFVCVLALAGTVSLWLRTTEIERRFWFFFSIAGTLILASQAYYTAYVVFVDRAGPEMPSVANALDMGAMGVFLALLGTLVRFRHASMAARIRYVLDLSAVSVVAAMLNHMLLVGPWFDSMGTASIWAKALNAVYPVVGVLLLFGAVRNVLGTRLQRWESWERLVGLGLASLALGLILYPLSYADHTWGFADPWGAAAVEVLWLSGIYFVFAGAMYRHTERKEVWRLRPFPALEASRGWVPSVVLPTVQTAAIPAFGAAAWLVSDPEFRVVAAAGVAALTVLLAARTLLTIADNGSLFSRAVTDPLTGLFNHRYFHEHLTTEMVSGERYDEPVSVIVLDLDDFSDVNSLGGHAAGDRALAGVARSVEQGVRERDTVCRLGGDEIGILLPETGSVEAAAVGGRVLEQIRGVTGPDGRPITASVGVATCPEHTSERDELVRRADGAQYWAKYHGKNHVVVYDPVVVLTLGAEERIRSLQSQAHLSTVRALAAAVDARDPATEHHSRKVAALSVLLAAEVGLDSDKAALLELAGLLHDVGKIGLPDSILRKAGSLTPAERLQVEGHSELGQRILASTRLDEILPWVRHHHERWDGTGYPDRLAGEAIPLEARILAVCDAYDAMMSDRPYRRALSREAVLQEIDLNLGTQFDPFVGEAFIGLAGSRRFTAARKTGPA